MTQSTYIQRYHDMHKSEAGVSYLHTEKGSPHINHAIIGWYISHPTVVNHMLYQSLTFYLPCGGHFVAVLLIGFY